MRHEIQFNNLEPEKRVRKLIEDRIASLEGKIRALPQDAVFLRVLVEKDEGPALYRISTTLDLPSKTLVAGKETHEDLKAAIRDAFAEINRQLEKTKSGLRGELFWKRLARREQIRSHTKDAGVEEEKRELFFSLVSPYLDTIQDLVGHAIRYSEALGDMPADTVTPEDIVDAALIRAYRDFAEGRAGSEIKPWLMTFALDQLEAETKRIQFDKNRTTHIEEDIPETPPTQQVSTLGDEILDFFQPDEDLKFEDLVPDIEVPTPEEETAAKELQQCVRAALVDLPREWRRVLQLHYLRGRSAAAIAKATGKPEKEIVRLLEYSRAYLAQRLVERGCSFRPNVTRAARQKPRP